MSKRKKHSNSRGNFASEVPHPNNSPAPTPNIYFLVAAWLLYVLVVYPAWKAPFIFDDIPGIVENPAIAASSIHQTLFASPSDATPYGRPIVSTSLALNHAFSGYTPWAFRLFNLVLHGANGFLLFLFLHGIGNLSIKEKQWIEPVALATAVLWLFHPLGTNVSLYIVQRAEGLVIFFLLLTLYAATRALHSDHSQKPRSAAAWTPWHWGTVLCCGMGMLSKESMVVAPVAVYLLDASLFSRSLLAPLKAKWRFYGALASTWIILGLVMWLWPRRHSVGTESGWGALQYFVVQMEVLPSYLFKAVWPATLHLDYWIFEPSGWVHVIAGFILLGLLFLAAVFGAWKGSALGYLGLLAFLVLAPTSTFVPVRSMPGAEYRFYLPLVAVVATVAAVVWILAHRVSKGHCKYVFLVLMLFCGIGLAARTHFRAGEIATPEKVWMQVLLKFPQNVRALNALGGFAMDAGRLDEAREQFRQAMEFHPEHGDAYASLGTLEGQNGNIELARKHLEKSVEVWPLSPTAWSNLAIVYADSNEFEKSEAAFRKSLELGPHLPEPNFNLGILYLRQSRYAEGQKQILQTLRLAPNHQGANDVRNQLRSARLWRED